MESSLFINNTEGNISKEMENFYICLNIGGVFKDTFQKTFLDVIKTYDFEK